MLRWLVPIIVIGIALIHWQPLSPYSATAGLVAVLWASFTAFVLKTSQIASQRQERRRLLADCDYQHDAWNRGNDRVAVYGRFQP